MKLRINAPAKINWSLEVLGKREHGYHEIRTVLQTIDLCDVVTLETADAISFEQVGSPAIPHVDNLAWRAAELLQRRTGCNEGAAITLLKNIPAAAGLGGGSSDAAAVLRGLNQLWRTGKTDEELAEIGGELGSDVPFFIYGGTALAEGRGERISVLRDAPERWLVLLGPDIDVPMKTATLYKQLQASDYSDGSATYALIEGLRSGELNESCLSNTFERVAFDVFPGLVDYRRLLAEAAGRSVHLAGSGPTLFSVFEAEEEARRTADRLRPGTEAPVFLAATLRTEDAVAVTEL